MSQALYSAITGIQTNQQNLNVIADNLANMNTIGFKSSQVNFESIFSKTIQSGSASNDFVGGTNPMQVGLGVQVSEIGRDFTNGTIQSTGRISDLNIQGDGFFTLKNPDGGIYLSRAGNFSLDNRGNLVNSNGFKVLGTADSVSNTGSETEIRIPQSLSLVHDTVIGADIAYNIENENGSIMRLGSFDVNGTAHSITETTTLTDIIAAIDGHPDLTCTLNANGKVDIQNTSGAPVILGSSGTDSTNALSVLGAPSGSTIAAGSTISSSVLKNTSEVTIDTDDSSGNVCSLSSYSIGADGAIEVTYSNGDKITATGSPSKELIYETSTGISIPASSITVNNNAIYASELQIQLCTVVNENGLLAEGGNLFSASTNSGAQTFGCGNGNGLGLIDSGGLESSNVDMTTEFTRMIVSQRGIEAASRIFSVQSDVLQQLSNLGR